MLVGLVWFLYAQTGQFEFLRLDDHDYTFRCAFVRDGLSWANACAALSNLTHAAIWMPVTYISYMVGISLFGPSMGAHHLVNVGIHSVNAILLFVLLLKIGQASVRAPHSPFTFHLSLFAFLATAFWAVHPQRAEAVAWIAGRKELLCTTFTLAGLLCWRGRGWIATGAGWLCCALACMSKPTAMCFPFLALAVEALDATETIASPVGGRRAGGAIGAIARYVPLFLMAIATGALAVYSQTHAEGYATRELFSASLPWRLLNAMVAVGLYLWQLVVPVGIHLDYRATPDRFPVDGTLGLVVFGVALAFFAFKLRKTLRGAQRGWGKVLLRAFPCELIFLAALAPTLGIFGSFGEHARADRFLYLPAIAIPILLVKWSSHLCVSAPLRETTVPGGSPRRSPVVWAKPVCGTLILGVVLAIGFSIPVVASYRNDFTAFSRTLACDPENGRALAHVGSEWCARYGKIDKGIECFRKSQALRPRDDTAAQLAYALAMRGLSTDFDEIRSLTGKFACDHSLDRKGMALEARGLTAMRQKRWDEAISCFADSIRAPLRFYNAEDASLNLAACLCNAGRRAESQKLLQPLTQSRRADIRDRATRALETLRTSKGRAYLFF